MFDDKEKRRQATKWIIEIITICILIYLGIRHIENIAGAVLWIFNLFKPLLMGVILALVLNVPMSFIERKLFCSTKSARKQKFRRPLAITLAFFLVLGIFAGVAFLVIPELVKAVKLIAQIAVNSLDAMAQWDEHTDFTQIPFGSYLQQIHIDWAGLKTQLEQWFSARSSAIVNYAMGAVSSLVSELVNFFIGLVFSIYILARKELLKDQVCRLIRVWLPENFGKCLIHVSKVCSTTFRDFIAGQATEAMILGVLCLIGMLILRIPYAPMIGALVGVTALIPIVGAFVGTIVGAVMILTVNPFKAVLFVIFLLILQQVEGNIIYPRVVGAKINLPAMWVLAAVTIGGSLAGPLGMLLGVPAASAAYTLLKEATNKREQYMNQKQPAD